jgi:flagellar assembly protein FliH
MILRSEGVMKTRVEGVAAALPIRLLGSGAAQGQGVSRLQFEVIDVSVDTAVADETVEDELAVSLIEEDQAAKDEELLAERRRIDAEIEAARDAGRMQARREFEDELVKRVSAERELVAQTCERFRREREGYFAAVEVEVVKLALAIAARVLHREVKLDPMLLQAVVKVALGKVAEESELVLRVPMRDREAWSGLMAGEETVEVNGDSRLVAGECVLETSVGRVELGVSAQLAEIEKGFFDLLQQRPS